MRAARLIAEQGKFDGFANAPLARNSIHSFANDRFWAVAAELIARRLCAAGI